MSLSLKTNSFQLIQQDVPCSVWKNGGTGTWGFEVAGMQQLYNAVRATGAQNLVIVTGLEYVENTNNHAR